MRLSVQEKQEIINLVDHSDLGVNRTLKQLGVNKSTFYKWYNAYLKKGTVGLASANKTRRQWNTIPEEQRQLVVKVALEHPVLSPQGNWLSGSPTNRGSLYQNRVCIAS